ncbi:PDR/VanB family oxidoreductase [Pseudomonas sp. GD03721]|nr:MULTISPECIES: PDR/VanB family oxidoreductase [unclassified Pseudomonas]MDH1443262.1 PDR/VanB family oxidoreductase [Pseudomonas sp. GD03722]WGG00688.1 PDR/VanB family oxidoreductase [Pseudomonas sp. GD03721]WGG04854.1 PDR/VanB family oxidoreductase [Pseudomonas sp. GD03919]
MTTSLNLKVNRILAEAQDVLSVELVDGAGGELPPFQPGAHLELHLRSGHIRHYSLLNDNSERQRYVVGVGLAAGSRGGSRFIHGSLREGDVLKVVGPRNNFPLDTQAGRYCLVAGGIGITPLLAMARWAESQGRDWRLIYTARGRHRAAFYEALMALDQGRGRVRLYFNDEQQGRLLDIDDLVASLAPDEHLYCCGPDPLMQAVKSATETIAERAHFEWFTPPATLAAAQLEDAEGFEVILRRSGFSVRVSEQQSILEALEEAGVEPPFSCRAGLCRSCETRVVAGTPDHRDLVLTHEEREANDLMLICCSRAHTPTLELDL